MVNDGLTDAFNDIHMGITAENICDQWGLTREELDEWWQALSKTEAAQAAESSWMNVPAESSEEGGCYLIRTSSPGRVTAEVDKIETGVQEGRHGHGGKCFRNQ